MKFNEPLKIVPVVDIPKAKDVPLESLMDIFRLCTKMEKICDVNDGIGLSAVQVGVPWNLFIVKRNRQLLHLNLTKCNLSSKIIITLF
jgi:peptide deformylase